MASKHYVAWISFMIAGVFGYMEVFHVDLTNDTNVFMHCALNLWRFGAAELYIRCFDENFPYHIMVYAPFAAFAGYYHIDPAIILHGACFIICIFSLFVLSRALKAQGTAEQDRYAWLAIAAFTLLTVPSMYGVFADREHFLFILCMPWIVQMLLQQKPLNHTCVMAAAGFCMKPHDFALFGLMTLTGGPREWSLTQRLFSAPSLIIAAFGACYVAIIFIFFPAFIFQVLPLSFIVYPTKYYSGTFKLNYALKYLIITGATMLAFIRSWPRLIPWIGFLAGCTIVFYLNAGWDYTFYLLCVPMLLTFALPWITHYAQEEMPLQVIKTVKFLIAGMMVMSIYSIGTEMGRLIPTHFRNHNTVNGQLTEAIRREAGDKMIILSLNVWNSQVEPFARTPEAVFGYDNLWTYRWLAAHPDNPHYQQVFHALTSSFLTAVKANPTAVIFDDITARTAITPDGIMGFLARDPGVLTWMRAYRITSILDYCSDTLENGCRFAVLKRQDIKAQ